MTRSTLPRSFLLAAILVAAPALAIQPGRWTHSTEADFQPGKTKDVVVTKQGEIKLSVAHQVLAQLPDKAANVYDVRYTANGDLYMAVGPETKLLRRKGEKVEEVASLSGQQIFAMNLTPEGKLLVGVSAATSRLAVLDGDKLLTLVELPGVRYIWDMVVDAKENTAYLATGTEGQLLSVNLAKFKPQAADAKPAEAPKKEGEKPALPDGVKVLLDAKQANLLCIGQDAQKRLYVGTDTEGLVYRVTLKPDGTADSVFVLYDAAEPEVAAILVRADGTVYVGTADADQARPGGKAEAPANTETGHPVHGPADDKPPASGPAAAPASKPAAQAPAPQDTAVVQGPSVEPVVGADNASFLGLQPGDRIVGINGQPIAKDSSTTIVKLTAALAEAMDDPSKPLQITVERRDGSGPVTLSVNPSAEPTKEQRDQLREVIRKRLEEARESGDLKPSATGGPSVRPGGPKPPGGARPGGPGGAGAKPGNAVYRIDSSGFTTEVFRDAVMVLRLMADPSDPACVLVATGNSGQLYRINTAAADEVTILLDHDSNQLSAMTISPDKKVVIGGSNPASVVALGSGFVRTGTFTSASLDASQVALWGKLKFTADFPANTSVEVQTRSGNVDDPDNAPWSAWSKAQVFKADRAASVPIEADIDRAKDGTPPARFLQYRLTLNGDEKATPVVDRVEVGYVVPNMKPGVTSLRGSYAGLPGQPGGGPRPVGPARPGQPGAPAAVDEPQPAVMMSVQWEASDPNNDRLKYVLEYQPLGTNTWVQIAKDLDAINYEWNTRRVPDGRYILRVTASDAPDNTPDMAKTGARLSDPVLVDNTPPTIKVKNDRADVAGKTATVTLDAEDALSPIYSVSYAVDSSGEYKPTVPKDMIFDSTKETVTITITDLSAGQHVVTLRATDAQGNTVYQAVTFDIK